MRLLVINGPNLNMLGTREPDVYGTESLGDLERQWRVRAARFAIGLNAMQSNHEGELIDVLQAEGPRSDGVVLNPGALSHYSYALHDAIAAIPTPVVEVHISNIAEREAWRRTSVTAPATERVIAGRGTRGYLDAIDHLWALSVQPPTTVTYGGDPDQVIELRVPNEPRGTVALVHGGFWRHIWARDIMDLLAIHLTERGWATANVEYRRGRDSFSASHDDIETALTTVAAHATGPGPVVIVGHSAGGYLALRHAARHADIDAVGLAPVIDLHAISESRPDDDPVLAYLGAASDEAPELWSAASMPTSFSGRAAIIHGSLDEPVPIDQSVAFARASEVPIESVVGAGHMDLIDPTSAAADVLTATLDGFLDGRS